MTQPVPTQLRVVIGGGSYDMIRDIAPVLLVPEWIPIGDDSEEASGKWKVHLDIIFS